MALVIRPSDSRDLVHKDLRGNAKRLTWVLELSLGNRQGGTSSEFLWAGPIRYDEKQFPSLQFAGLNIYLKKKHAPKQGM